MEITNAIPRPNLCQSELLQHVITPEKNLTGMNHDLTLYKLTDTQMNPLLQLYHCM